MLLNMLAMMQAEGVSAVHQMVGVGLGIGLALIGAGIGLGKIGGDAAMAIARQPEAVNDIRGTALLIAFLMEGATIIAVIMTFVAVLV
jgi:F-type H+-transporting ATPase subunit c